MRYVAKMYLSARNFFAKKEEGASIVEYGLLVALIALGCIVALGAMGDSLSGLFTGISTTVGGVDTGPR